MEESDVVDRERAMRRYQGGESPTAICRSMGYSRQWFYKWLVRFYSLNTVDLATARSTAEPVLSRTAQDTVTAFWASWQRLGVPRIQQVDNDPVFYGNRARPRALGPLIRLCLWHNVEPWFIPVGEPWRNGVVEKFNDWWHQHGPLRQGEVAAP